MNLEQNTGESLRAIYASTGGVRSVFSSKVTDYVISRPDYPPALFEALTAVCGLTEGATVADIGAGTGLLTRGLLQTGCQVIAVEPNPDMRQAADDLLSSMAGYRSVDGSAEKIPLETGSVHLITAAQAFHWFDVELARAEFLRVLNPQGQVAIIWNDRVLEDPLHRAFDEIAAEFGGAKRATLVAHESERSDVWRLFGAARPQEFSWPHAHHLNEEGLLALVFSRSYIPARDSGEGRVVADRVRGLFSRFAASGTIEVRYRTLAFVGRPK